MKSMKFFISLVFLSLAMMGYKTYEQYNGVHEVQRLIVLNESRSLSQFITSFRETYQKTFADNNISINPHTINILPVKTLTEISNRFASSVQGDITIRTVSDRPRNAKNLANGFELERINYFKENPQVKDSFVVKDNIHYYTKPLLVQQSCLRCHGKKEDAPLGIQERYDGAYDYSLGEARGLINIQIKERDFLSKIHAEFKINFFNTIVWYLVFLAIIYVLLRDAGLKEEQYTKKLEEDIEEKTYELNKQKDILYNQAYHDGLTGLPNRTLFNDRIEHGIELAKRHKSKLALFFIDLDHFKQINDSLGHHIGDKVLIEATNRLKGSIRAEDTLARLGGDEFTIIMEDLRKTQDTSILATKILKAFNEPMYIENHTLYASCSIGISLYPKDDTEANNLIKYADSAMYKAKEEGRNNFQFYSSEMTVLALERVVMEASMREAFAKKEFLVCYQPQIDADSGSLTGMEALIRWQHPEQGLLLPDMFIPLAEDTGFIVEIDRWVMHTAMSQFAKWYKEGLAPGVLALNLSIRQLRSNDFIKTLQNIMIDVGFESKWLELEVTEGQMMKNPEESIAKLREISKMGIEIAIDDFGTGYSSLAYLKRLPVDKLKIDQSFVKGIPNNTDDAAIIKAIIALSKVLNLDIIAEGVESDNQKAFLIDNGCDNMQGYYYEKAISPEDIKIRWLDPNSPSDPLDT